MKAKTKLYRAHWARTIDVVLICLLLFIFFAHIGGDVEFGALVLICGLWLMATTGSFCRVYLTTDFLEKDSAKILYKDITEVRKFFWWYIAWDCYNDSIWVPIGFLRKNSGNLLINWLKDGTLEEEAP